VLRFTNSHKVNAVMKFLLGEVKWRGLLERSFIGRELVIVAERI